MKKKTLNLDALVNVTGGYFTESAQNWYDKFEADMKHVTETPTLNESEMASIIGFYKPIFDEMANFYKTDNKSHDKEDLVKYLRGNSSVNLLINFLEICMG